MLAPFLALVVVSPLAVQAQEADIEALVERVQAHYDAQEGFEADFTQRYERRFLSRAVQESGKLHVKKPGRMRWEYLVPDEKLFVTDGAKSYFYLPLEKQVMVSHHPQGAMGMEEGSPFELLAGRARLTDSFEVFSSQEPPKRGGVMLHLAPTSRHEEFEDVELEVDADTGAMLRVVLIDASRNRTEFVFDNVRTDGNLPESLFRFTVPEGVEVVLHDAPTQDP